MLEHPYSSHPYLGKACEIGQSAGQVALTEAELGWLGGLWDGEGSITVFRRQEKGNWKYCPVICVTNCDVNIIQKAVELLDRVGIRLHVFERESENVKHKNGINAGTRKLEHVKKFTQMMIPYLVGKKSQAILTLRFVERRLNNKRTHVDESEKLELNRLSDEIRILNRKGQNVMNPQRLHAEPQFNRG